jgi:hypothetical protein
MSLDDDRDPAPYQRMRPAGLPGFLVFLFMTFAFSTLFVSRDTAETLFLVMLAVALVAVGFTVWRVLQQRRS